MSLNLFSDTYFFMFMLYNKQACKFLTRDSEFKVVKYSVNLNQGRNSEVLTIFYISDKITISPDK